MLAIYIVSGCLVYLFIGIILGKIVYKKTECSAFWDAYLASITTSIFWPIIILLYSMHKYTDKILLFIETREHNKSLPKATAKDINQ